MTDNTSVQPVVIPKQPQAYGAEPTLPDIGIPLIPVPRVDPQEAVDQLKDVVGKKGKYLGELGVANEQNLQLKKDFETGQQSRNTQSIDALNNIARITKWPSKLANLMGLFDSDYNRNYQESQIQLQSAKSKNEADKTQTLMDINNLRPAITKTQADLSEEAFNLQMKGFDLASKTLDMDQKTIQLRANVAQLGITMRQDVRDQMKFDIDKMTLPQLRAERAQAAAGKGRFAGVQGFIDDAINNHVKGELELNNLDIAVKQGRVNLDDATMKNIEEHQRRLLGTIPPDTQSAFVANALANGDQFINIKGANGKTAQIPIGIAIEEADKHNKAQAGFEAGAVANSALLLGQSLGTESNRANTLAAAGDPAAQRTRVLVEQLTQQIDPNKPGTFPAANAMLAIIKKQNDENIKRYASTAGTSEAKAALEQWGDTGKFTRDGAASVISDRAGKPGGLVAGKYQSANAYLNSQIFSQVNLGKLGLDPKAPIDIGSILAGNKQTKLQAIVDNVMSDPIVSAEMSRQIENQYRVDMFENSLADLAKATPVAASAAASGIFNRALAKYKNHEFDVPTKDASGKTVNAFAPGELNKFLEEQTVNTKRQVDYNQMLIDNIEHRITAEPEHGVQDPKYTPNDQAQETYYINDTNARGVLGMQFTTQLRRDAAAARQVIDKKLQQDLSGQTQAGVLNAVVGLSAAGGVPGASGGIMDAELMGRVQQNAPSAAVHGSTAADMRRLYTGQ